MQLLSIVQTDLKLNSLPLQQLVSTGTHCIALRSISPWKKQYILYALLSFTSGDSLLSNRRGWWAMGSYSGPSKSLTQLSCSPWILLWGTYIEEWEERLKIPKQTPHSHVCGSIIPNNENYYKNTSAYQ